MTSFQMDDVSIRFKHSAEAQQCLQGSLILNGVNLATILRFYTSCILLQSLPTSREVFSLTCIVVGYQIFVSLGN